MSKYQADEQWLAQLQTGNDLHWKAFYEEVRQALKFKVERDKSTIMAFIVEYLPKKLQEELTV